MVAEALFYFCKDEMQREEIRDREGGEGDWGPDITFKALLPVFHRLVLTPPPSVSRACPNSTSYIWKTDL